MPVPKSYMGDTIRHSSATLLADFGVNITTLKRHGGWKSSAMDEGNIDDLINCKRNTGNQITWEEI